VETTKGGKSRPEDFNAFQDMIRAHFIPQTSEENIRQKLYDLKQKGSVSQYSTDFRRFLLLNPRMSMKDQIFQFKQGLKPEILVEVNVRRPCTLDEAEEIALHVDSFCSKQINNPQGNKPSTGVPRANNPGGSNQQNSPVLQ
jgi:Ty3 transposon capsid-like protein